MRGHVSASAKVKRLQYVCIGKHLVFMGWEEHMLGLGPAQKVTFPAGRAVVRLCSNSSFLSP